MIECLICNHFQHCDEDGNLLDINDMPLSRKHGYIILIPHPEIERVSAVCSRCIGDLRIALDYDRKKTRKD
jgi:hypothetical protein